MNARYVIACAQVEWKFRCPQRWGDLAATGDDNVRYCAHCRQPVHLARTPAQLNALARRGACVAWDGEVAEVGEDGEHEPVMLIGEVRPMDLRGYDED